jgi:hypothetical protein
MFFTGQQEAIEISLRDEMMTPGDARHTQLP